MFAPSLWRRLSGRFRLDAVITFSSVAAPFPNVDTNAVIVLMANECPQPTLLWARCDEAGAPSLRNWIETDFAGSPASLTVIRRQARERMLPAELLRRAIGRTRDLDGEEVTAADLDRLERAGRPTWLLALGDQPLPATVRAYLRTGESQGLPARTLIASRRPWYKMEVRQPPPFLFAYLGRRSVRFILNRAGVVPLTGFLCVYPRPEWNSPDGIEALWTVLRDPHTLANLALVDKSYGNGAIKVEPCALERLPLPESLHCELGARPHPFEAATPAAAIECRLRRPRRRKVRGG